MVMLMKRYSWIAGAFLITVLLVVAEAAIIVRASGDKIKEEVVFAKVQIDKNTLITENMLEIREVDSEYVHPAAVKSISDAVSKRAAIKVEAGEMMLAAKLLPDDETGVTDGDNRLFSVRFDADQANGWQLTENQLVDIIYVPNNPEKEQVSVMVRKAVVSEEQANAEKTGSENDIVYPDGVTVLKNIRIARIIDEYGKPFSASRAENVPRYISFEVTGPQAAFLAYAKRNGRLEIACIPD